MMKMSTSDDFPSGRVPEQDPGSFLMATEACGGRTPDLGYFLEVWGFIGEVGVENKSGAPRRVHEAQGRALGGWARPPPSWGPRASPPVTLCSSNFYIFQKKPPWIFSAFRELLFLHKNNTIVILLKTASVRVSFTQIMQIIFQNKSKSIRKSRYARAYQLPQA